MLLFKIILLQRQVVQVCSAVPSVSGKYLEHRVFKFLYTDRNTKIEFSDSFQSFRYKQRYRIHAIK